MIAFCHVHRQLFVFVCFHLSPHRKKKYEQPFIRFLSSSSSHSPRHCCVPRSTDAELCVVCMQQTNQKNERLHKRDECCAEPEQFRCFSFSLDNISATQTFFVGVSTEREESEINGSSVKGRREMLGKSEVKQTASTWKKNNKM